MILDLWGIGFHAVVVFGLGKDFLFKFILGRCVQRPPLCAIFSLEKKVKDILKELFLPLSHKKFD